MNKSLAAFELLVQTFGVPRQDEAQPRENPLAHLIEVVIAQNTSRANRNQALENLTRRFPDPALIAEAELVDIIDAIYVAGLANSKAPRLKALVAAVLDTTDGTADLSFLYDLSVEEAHQFLTGLPGIGSLSASLILLFTLGRSVLPVNTGLHRVAQRVGMIPRDTGPDRAQWMLQRALPSEAYYPFHVNMVRHAREVCHKGRPICAQCCLAPLCNWVHVGTVKL